MINILPISFKRTESNLWERTEKLFDFSQLKARCALTFRFEPNLTSRFTCSKKQNLIFNIFTKSNKKWQLWTERGKKVIETLTIVNGKWRLWIHHSHESLWSLIEARAKRKARSSRSLNRWRWTVAAKRGSAITKIFRFPRREFHNRCIIRFNLLWRWNFFVAQHFNSRWCCNRIRDDDVVDVVISVASRLRRFPRMKVKTSYATILINF